MTDVEFEKKCKFLLESVDDEISHLSWDASEIVNPNTFRYDAIIKSTYNSYLRKRGKENHIKLYSHLKPQPEEAEVGTGTFAIFIADLEEVKKEIMGIIKLFVCTVDDMKLLLEPFIAAKLPITNISAFDTVIYDNKDGIPVLGDSYYVNVEGCNKMYVLISYDFTNLTKLHKRIKAFATRLHILYKSYKETQEIHSIPSDDDSEFYVRIEDISMFLKGVERIIQDEIKMEYF